MLNVLCVRTKDKPSIKVFCTVPKVLTEQLDFLAVNAQGSTSVELSH